MVWIPGGTFRMGSDTFYPEERPVHRVTVGGFWIDKFPVTNEQFARFVGATRHVTFAEIRPNPTDYPGALPHLLFAGSLVFVQPDRPVDARNHTNWWQLVQACTVAGPVRRGQFHRFAAGSPGRARDVRLTPRHLRDGRARRSRPKPSGSSPLAGAWTVRRMRGATTRWWTIATWPTRGKANFRGRT